MTLSVNVTTCPTCKRAGDAVIPIVKSSPLMEITFVAKSSSACSVSEVRAGQHPGYSLPAAGPESATGGENLRRRFPRRKVFLAELKCNDVVGPINEHRRFALRRV